MWSGWYLPVLLAAAAADKQIELLNRQARGTGMTPERTKELLPVMQAFAEGKKIRTKVSGHSAPWHVTDDPTWSPMQDYEVVPEPEVLFVVFNDRSLPVGHTTFQQANSKAISMMQRGAEFAKVKKFVEVIE